MKRFFAVLYISIFVALILLSIYYDSSITLSMAGATHTFSVSHAIIFLACVVLLKIIITYLANKIKLLFSFSNAKKIEDEIHSIIYALLSKDISLAENSLKKIKSVVTAEHALLYWLEAELESLKNEHQLADDLINKAKVLEKNKKLSNYSLTGRASRGTEENQDVKSV